MKQCEIVEQALAAAAETFERLISQDLSNIETARFPAKAADSFRRLISQSQLLLRHQRSTLLGLGAFARSLQTIQLYNETIQFSNQNIQHRNKEYVREHSYNLMDHVTDAFECDWFNLERSATQLGNVRSQFPCSIDTPLRDLVADFVVNFVVVFNAFALDQELVSPTPADLYDILFSVNYSVVTAAQIDLITDFVRKSLTNLGRYGAALNQATQSYQSILYSSHGAVDVITRAVGDIKKVIEEALLAGNQKERTRSDLMTTCESSQTNHNTIDDELRQLKADHQNVLNELATPKKAYDDLHGFRDTMGSIVADSAEHERKMNDALGRELGSTLKQIETLSSDPIHVIDGRDRFREGAKTSMETEQEVKKKLLETESMLKDSQAARGVPDSFRGAALDSGQSPGNH